MKIIIAILVFSFIIIFHEMGHFLVAKACDVKVNEFQLGLGPRLFGVTKGETTFSLHALPFGGACVMEGEEEESDDERAFNKKNVWQRMAIVVAGPMFNFILAFILAVIIVAFMGYDKPVVTKVMEGYPAEEAGIKAGDEIVALNHYRIHFYRQVSVYSFLHPAENVTVTYKRNDKTHKVNLTPALDEESGRYLLGITGGVYEKNPGPLEVIVYGWYEVEHQIYVTFASLKMLVMRQLSLNDMSGPVGIVKVIGDSYEESAKDGILYVVMNMFSISVLLSANLGVMNLLPIPALDGGRLLIYIIEVLRRKPMNEQVEQKINYAGFAFLMALMVLILFNDLYKLFA